MKMQYEMSLYGTKHIAHICRVIYLQNGYTLTGYSKKVGQNERRDKVDLLTNWILRDLLNGYLDKATTNPKITPIERIEYYAKEGWVLWAHSEFILWFPRMDQQQMDGEQKIHFVYQSLLLAD